MLPCNSPAQSVIGRIRKIDELSSLDRDTMFSLMCEHYAGVTRPCFERDLANKDWILDLFQPGLGVIVGFSTQKVIEISVDGSRVLALFSGDTIIARDHWGSSALLRAWGELAQRLMADAGEVELYWWLICQAVRTYRFLPTFFKEFYPRYDVRTPIRQQQIIDSLGRIQFAEAYDFTQGVIRVNPSTYILRHTIADIDPEVRRDPHHQFFVQRNPGFAAGDELSCITPLTVQNFTRAGRRVAGLPMTDPTGEADARAKL